MIKELRNNCVAVVTCLIIVLIGFLIYFSAVNSKIGLEILTFEDKDIAILEDDLYYLKNLRGFYNANDNVDNLFLIQYGLDNLDEGDYTLSNIESKKNLCKASDNISFKSSENCDVIVFSNETIKNIIENKIMINQELVFSDIQYKNMDCKNDGSNFYCLLKPYKSSINDYSLVKDIIQKNDKVIIRDYFFSIDVSNFDICSSYYDVAYCSNYIDALKPDLSDDVIKKEGLLYEFVFVKNDNGYFLKSISVI